MIFPPIDNLYPIHVNISTIFHPKKKTEILILVPHSFDKNKKIKKIVKWDDLKNNTHRLKVICEIIKYNIYISLKGGI